MSRMKLPESQPSSAVRRTLEFVDPAGKSWAVTAVKKGLPFQQGSFTGNSVLGIVIGLLFESVLEDRAARESRWKVAVGRTRWSGNTYAHKETLPAGVDPGDRMTQLAKAIMAGEALS